MRLIKILATAVAAVAMGIAPALAHAAATDGSLDTSFTNSASPTIGVGLSSLGFTRLAQRQDGKFVGLSANSSNHIFVFNPDGSGFTQITSGAGFDDTVSDISVDTQNRILATGVFSSYAGTSVPSLIRIRTDGQLDTSFAFTGWTPAGTSQRVVALSSGKILVAASGMLDGSSNQLGPVVRINSDGSLDNTFVGAVPPGMPSAVTPGVLEVTADGGVIVGTNDGTNTSYVYKLTSTGTLDNTFTPVTCTGNNANIGDVAERPNGGFIIGGWFQTCASHNSNGIIGVTASGAYDSTFVTGEGLAQDLHGDFVSDIQPQRDGKVIAVGVFRAYKGGLVHSIIRLLPNGSLDPTFNPGSGFIFGSAPEQPRAVRIVDAGGIIVAGLFSEYDGQPTGGIIALDNAPNQAGQLANTGASITGALWASLLLLIGGIATLMKFRHLAARAEK